MSPWLAGLYVDPAYRRQGVGELLVNAIVQQARQRGDRALHLYTTSAVGYYERLGWSRARPLRLERHFDRADATRLAA